MPFVKNPQPMKKYHFTFWLSGTDRDGQPLTQHESIGWDMWGNNQEHATDRLRDIFIESVEVNITSCEEITL